MAPVLSAPHFHDEEAAYAFLEAKVWPNGPVCPHCGATERISKMQGKSTRIGAYKCYVCRSKFTVKVGTVFESSHVPLHIWLQAVALLTASKKGISSNQLHRTLGVTLKTAWFMSHRIREAMRELHPTEPLGGIGKYVEVDETVIGGKERNKHKSKRNPNNIGMVGKEIAFALVERGGRVRSYQVPNVNAHTLRPIIMEQVKQDTALMTDDAGQDRIIGPAFARYETVNHGIQEYVRGDVHTNTIEGYFSIMKRGITGVYHHVGAKHLKRYLAEFDFRYNYRVGLGVHDIERSEQALRGIVGKRLTYRTTNRG